MVQNLYMAKRVLNALRKELYKLEGIEIKDRFSRKELKKVKSMILKFEYIKKDIVDTLDKYHISSEEDISKLTPEEITNLSRDMISVIMYHGEKPKTFKDVYGPSSAKAVGIYNVLYHLQRLYNYITQRETRKTIGERIRSEDVEKLKDYLKEEIGSTASYIDFTIKILERGIDTLPIVEKKYYEKMKERYEKESEEKRKYRFGSKTWDLIDFFTLGSKTKQLDKEFDEKYKSEVPLDYGTSLYEFGLFDETFLTDTANLRKMISSYRKILSRGEGRRRVKYIIILLLCGSIPFLFYKRDITGSSILSNNYDLGIVLFVLILIVYILYRKFKKK